jgi:hypothetical protein
MAASRNRLLSDEILQLARSLEEQADQQEREAGER